MYGVTLYINSGFNINNGPISADVLAKSAQGTITAPALDLVQNYVLQSVTISAAFDRVKYADYAKIGDFFYTISGITALDDGETLRLDLVPDYLLSVGINGCDFTDGIVERRTITAAEDVFGRYSEDDPLLGCNEPLKVAFSDMKFNDASDKEYTLLTSQIDLVKLSDVDTQNLKALLWKYETSEDYLTTPNTQPFYLSKDKYTKYKLSTEDKTVTSAGSAVYDADAEKVSKGLMTARDLSLEGSVTAQVSIPESYVSVLKDDDGHVSQVTGKGIVTASSLNKVYSENIRHKRLLYGNICRYGLISASGEKVEFVPEDIMDDKDEQPNIRCLADPRLDGKPYFRYEKYLSDSSAQNFFQNAISGLSWRGAPLAFQQASGAAINAAKTEQAQKYLDYQIAQQKFNIRTGEVAGIAGGLIQTVLGALTANPAGFLGGAGKMISAGIGAELTAAQFERPREQEALAYGVQSNLSAPDVRFTYNAEIIRDFYGNGCYAYRYYPTDDDVRRIDTLLSMYGYKMTKPLTKADFSVGAHYTYVQARGVQVTNLPKWWADGVAAQLEAGVRLWKERPSSAAYQKQL